MPKPDADPHGGLEDLKKAYENPSLLDVPEEQKFGYKDEMV